MTDTTAEFVTTAVDYVLVAAFISAMVFIFSAGQQISSTALERQALSKDLSEYRKHNQYDLTTVYQQDIVAAIFKNRGTPYVQVTTNTGTYTWAGHSSPCAYTTVAVTGLIPADVVYDSKLVRGTSGEVIGYVFEYR